jgi:hypothetical protein
MIIAKITPAATKVTQVNPFSSVTENLDYMTVAARPYVVGSSETNFQISFGTVELNNEGVVTRFKNESNERMKLTSEELSTWGTNDEVLLEIVATKLNVSIVSFENVESNMF